MGHALIWVEGLGVALLCLALATAWAARGWAVRWLWVAAVFLFFAAPAAWLVMFTAQFGPPVRTTWFSYTLSWLLTFLVLGLALVWRGRRREGPGLGREAAAWPRGRLWLGLGGMVLALGLTVWNLDLSARADLAIARQEAGAFLLSVTPPPVPDADNAALVYEQAMKELIEPIREPWAMAARRGVNKVEPLDWTDAYPVGLVKKHEATLALLRKAAAMPRCSFDTPHGPLDAIAFTPPGARRYPGLGAVLLAVDARVQASNGDLKRAFDDVSAILGIARHLAQDLALWQAEVMAWRTLEDVLLLAPPGKGPLPALTIPELPPMVRKVRQEQALLAFVLPTAASQPSLVTEDLRKNHGPWTAWLMETVGGPLARVFVIPDELAAMRRLIDGHNASPRYSRDETPDDWAALRRSVETDPTSLYGAVFVKPKHQVLARDGGALAALRQTARAGLAAAAYHRKHGKYPDRLEQLVPDFLPAVPTDPRDGQVMRWRHLTGMIVFHMPQEAAAVGEGKASAPEGRRLPIFRVYLHGEGR